ncbi:MAG: hypothetical protein ACR2Q4_13355 [Geminicoccaceae bacterium]
MMTSIGAVAADIDHGNRMVQQLPFGDAGLIHWRRRRAYLRFDRRDSH